MIHIGKQKQLGDFNHSEFRSQQKFIFMGLFLQVTGKGHAIKVLWEDAENIIAGITINNQLNFIAKSFAKFFHVAMVTKLY